MAAHRFLETYGGIRGDFVRRDPPKDGIPSIDSPRFVSTNKVRGLGRDEPVISLAMGGEMRAYPLSVLIWHGIRQ